MGNRAVITTEAGWRSPENNLGVYVHWNGGRDSIEGFLKYCELHGYRSPDYDCYGWAYLAGVISNFFGDGLSVGVDIVSRLDTNNGDNGVYIIRGWEIIRREEFAWNEQRRYNIGDMLREIDKHMPSSARIPDKIEEFVDSKVRKGS